MPTWERQVSCAAWSQPMKVTFAGGPPSQRWQGIVIFGERFTLSGRWSSAPVEARYLASPSSGGGRYRGRSRLCLYHREYSLPLGGGSNDVDAGRTRTVAPTASPASPS